MGNLSVDKAILLEEIKLEHTEIISEALNENRIFLGRWLPFVGLSLKKENTESFIHRILSSENDELFVIRYLGEFAGLISYKEIDRINQKAEIGYWLCENKQGKGIMTKCTLKLIKHAFTIKKLNRIQIKTAVGNTKSSNIPKRLNFRLEGIERQGERFGNKYHDLEVYSILKSEFFATNA